MFNEENEKKYNGADDTAGSENRVSIIKDAAEETASETPEASMTKIVEDTENTGLAAAGPEEIKAAERSMDMEGEGEPKFMASPETFEKQEDVKEKIESSPEVKIAPKKNFSFAKFAFISFLVVALGFSSGFGYRYASSLFSSKNIGVITSRSEGGTATTLSNEARSSDITNIVEKYSPAIVSVVYEGNSFLNSSPQVIGTGVVFSEDEESIYIVSNQHVIYDTMGGRVFKRENPIYIAFEGKVLHKAEILGSDSLSDLAVVKLKKSDISKEVLSKLKPVTFADSDKTKVGEWVVAIGNPLGYVDTSTFGIVSGKDRKLGKELDVELIQIDAAINEGNSGGATFNTNGEVIGINTIKIKDTGVEGLGFAVASNDVLSVVSEILEKGRVERPFLGIQGLNIASAVNYDVEIPEEIEKGVYLIDIVSGTSAEKAGLKNGDIITQVDGKDVASMSELSEVVKSKKVGDTIEVGLYRQGKHTSLSITLGARPASE